MSAYFRDGTLGAVALIAIVHGLYYFLLVVGLGFISLLLDTTILILALICYRSFLRSSPYRLYRLDDHPEAVSALREGLLLNPDSSLLHQRLALYSLYARNYGGCLHHLERCQELRGREPALGLFKGIALWCLGRRGEGEALMRESLEKIPPSRLPLVRRKVTRLVRDEALKEQVLGFLALSAEAAGSAPAAKRHESPQALHNSLMNTERARTGLYRFLPRGGTGCGWPGPVGRPAE